MTAIARQSAKIFAQNAPVGQVTAFRTTESTPQTTKAPDQIQNENYLQGWLNADGSGNVLPYAEDMNGLFYTLSYNTAYLYEKGIPEYSSTQTYYLNSFCQYSGKIYRCKGDSVVNILPTNTNYWDALPSSSYTATTVGAGTTNYGTVYAGTNTAGTQFQFKTIIGGNNVTISQTDDSLTISASTSGYADFSASSPLSYTNGVLSIPAATSSQNGYLTASDWLSFNSKLSSTIFSSNNTWTGTNTFSTILPSSISSTLGNSSNYWTIYGASLISDDGIDLSYKDSRFVNSSFTLGYNGSNLGFFPRMSATDGYDSYLGNTVYRWDYGYFDNLNSNYLTTLQFKIDENSGLTITSKSGGSVVTAAMAEYDATTRGLALYTLDDNRGTLGYRANRWSQIYAVESHTSSIYPGYDLTNSDSKIALYYNTNATETTPTQWGWMGYLSSSYIGLFPSTTETGSLGGPNNIWKEGYLNTLFLNRIESPLGVTNITLNTNIVPNGDNKFSLGSDTNRLANVVTKSLRFTSTNSFYADTNTGTIFFSWYDSNGNTNRSIRWWDNRMAPFASGVDLGGNSSANRWSTIYYTTLNPSSDSRLKNNIEPLDSGLEIVNNLAIKSYTFKNAPDHIEYGIIAQDVVDKHPELISVPESEDGTYGIYLHNFIFASLRAIQELSAKVENLENQLREIRNED